mmetsp:Transcript_13662/g.31397  ORF Transcript_13662/g.31397 Transcript_13662/m.31397 type:complete len:88 (-) Transcript_13662:170-433(-)
MTLLTVAHRLSTIIDYDQLLVLRDGRLLEHGPPAQLLDDPFSAVSQMASSLGADGEQQLRSALRSSLRLSGLVSPGTVSSGPANARI